ncbi:MAG TPA: hypothetical protein VH395_14365 [Jatrophihabitantaceae bacterium]|jgi:hypothetical protein
MARIDDRLLIQRVDQLIVIVDESAGVEIEFPVALTPMVLRVLAYLATDPNGE